jgi:AraC-like DNA-binding protein
MNPTSRKLTARFTITQKYVGLSMRRPVRAEPYYVGSTVWPHDHTYYEISVINRGQATHQTEFFDAPARQGTVVVIPPGKVHAFVDGQQLAVTNVYYLAEWFLGELKHLWEHEALIPLFLADSLFPRSGQARPFQFDLTPAEYEDAMIDLDHMKREWDLKKPSVLYMESCFLKLLILLSRSYVRQAPGEMYFQFRRAVWLALESIEKLTVDSQAFSVSRLAKEVSMSAIHFTRVFKRATGWAPTEYFQMRRVHHACKLLLNPEHNISEVAQLLGYADAPHLSRIFKRFRGMTPRDYRRMYVTGQREGESSS